MYKVQQSWGEWFLHARRNDRGLTETPHSSLRGLMRMQNLCTTASDSGKLENLAGIGVPPVLDCHLGRVGKADRYMFAAEPIRLITRHTPHTKAFPPKTLYLLIVCLPGSWVYIQSVDQ